MYLGRVAAVVASVYPAGLVRQNRLELSTVWSQGKSHLFLNIDFTFGKRAEGMEAWDEGFQKAINAVEKAGKKKNWAIGGIGYKVAVKIDGKDYST